MERKGFTLIELLAVIVILAIIAVIATPIITNIIEDSKKASFERSVEGIVKGLDLDVAFKLKDNGYTYKLNDGEIIGLDEDSNVSISNTKGYNGEIRYDKDAFVSYAIYNDSWCVIKIDNETDTFDYIEGDCIIPTSKKCFKVKNVEGGVSITDYDSACGVDVIIPSKINNKKVVTIGDSAFKIKQLVSVIIPNSVTSIGQLAFQNNQLTNVIIPDSVISIGYSAFSWNNLINVTMGNNVTNIEKSAFLFNKLTSIIIPSSVTSIGASAFYKTNSSNSNLNSIINKTDIEFDWGNILNGSSGYNFKTGTVVNSYGNVEVTSE